MAANPPTTKLPVISHHEVRETFADQIGFLVCDGSTLKIDFEVVRMNEAATPALPEKERHVVARVVLSMNGAVDLINQMTRLAEQLAKSGRIRNDRGQAVPLSEKIS